MRREVILGTAVLAVCAALAACLFVPREGEPAEITTSGDPVRGEYVLRLGGCVTCHTDDKNGGAFLAGGRALSSPYGTFYTSNITPDPATGIGGWSTAAFVHAMTEGISPDGHPYFPAFPYTSYTKMRQSDLVDLKAYLDTVAPVANQVPDHDLRFPFGFRPLLRGWQLLFFEKGTFQPDPDRSETWNRGAYIVNGPGHCSECHTPRNLLGGPERDRFLAGTRDGPDGKPVPNITPDEEDGIGKWSKSDLTFVLKTSILPDGDVLGGAMAEMVEGATSHWTDQDREAVADYLFTVAPLKGKPAPAEEKPAEEG